MHAAYKECLSGHWHCSCFSLVVACERLQAVMQAVPAHHKQICGTCMPKQALLTKRNLKSQGGASTAEGKSG